MKRMVTEDCYKMTSSPRGYCVIVNNQHFVGDKKDRKGSEVDANGLKGIFGKLGFSVDIKNDLKAQEIDDLIAEYKLEKKLKRTDMFVFIVLSHGDKNIVYGSDNRKVEVEDGILANFNNQNCPRLAGKPKLFIFQTCRGYNEAKQIVRRLSNDSEIEHDSPSTTTSKEAVSPLWGDMLVAFSTIPSYVSQRHTTPGSWYIQTLINVFDTHAERLELTALLNTVSRELQKRVSSRGLTQTCEYWNRGFNKALYF